MPLADILGIVAIAVGLVGLVPVIDAIREKSRERRGIITWAALQKAVKVLYEKMQDNEPDYSPDYIVCIGRAGAVAGAMLSHHFTEKTIPIMVISVEPKTRALQAGPSSAGQARTDQVVDCCDIKDGLQNVLLLAIDIWAGPTVQTVLEELVRRQITPKIACVFWNPLAPIKPRFYAEKREGARRLRYPWAGVSWERRPPGPVRGDGPKSER